MSSELGTDSCTTQLKVRGPARTSNESKEKEELGTNKTGADSGPGFLVKILETFEVVASSLGSKPRFRGGPVLKVRRLLYHSTLGLRVMTKRCRPAATHRNVESGV